MADAYQMFIDGEWVNSSDGQTRDVINPATGEVLATVQEGTKEDAKRAVAAAKRAFEGDWFDSTPKDRQLALLKFADRIEEHADEIVKLEAQNVGKPAAVTLSEEIPPIVDNLRFFAGAARTMEGRAAGEYMAGFTSYVRREPIGVAGSDRAVELPVDDGDLEDRSRTGDRQRDRAEALGDDAADGAQARRAHGGPPPARRLQCGDRRRRPRRGHDRATPRCRASSRSPATRRPAS